MPTCSPFVSACSLRRRNSQNGSQKTYIRHTPLRFARIELPHPSAFFLSGGGRACALACCCRKTARRDAAGCAFACDTDHAPLPTPPAARHPNPVHRGFAEQPHMHARCACEMAQERSSIQYLPLRVPPAGATLVFRSVQAPSFLRVVPGVQVLRVEAAGHYW